MNLLAQKLAPYKILLGSQSPRRAQLLQGLDIDFSIQVKDVCESFPLNLPVETVPQYIAGKKFDAFIPDIDDETFLITADTVVILENKILQKPESLDQARRLLQLLSEKTHTVITGVCYGLRHKKMSFSAKSDVTFAVLSDQEIDYYVHTYPPLDKAGAYGVQEWIGYIGIQSITGSYFNIMGLPVQALYQHILEYHV